VGALSLFKLNNIIMKEREFKIGDRVRIRPDSSYNSQCSDIGTVVKSTSSRGWISVDFDNGYQNSYPAEDLYFDEPHVDQEFHVGDMVQITQGSGNWAPEMNDYVGKIATIKSVKHLDDYCDDYIYKIDIDGGKWNWWPSKGHFIHALQHGLDQKDELLYRAEQMFPVGTRFSPAHVSFDKEDDEYCVMTDDSVIAFDHAGNICATIHDDNYWDHTCDSKYGNTRMNRVLYYKPMNRWATIVKEAPQFKVGDKVMITESKNNWCPEMDEFVGIIATLVKIKGSKGTHYAIDLDKGEWAWSDKDGHFRKPTKEELATTEPEPIKHKYKIGEKVMLTERHNAVDPQEVTIRDYSKSTDKPAYVIHTWVGHFPEDILSPIEEYELVPKEDFLAMAELKYPIGTKYKCATGGDYVYTVRDKQSFSLHNPTTVYGNSGQGCLYKDGKWAQIVESVKPDFKFKVGDFVVGNSKANTRYCVTREGWTGEVTKVEERNGGLFMSVQGKYNLDNSEYHSLDADYFDLTTEDEHDPRVVLTATTTPASYTLQEEFDRVTASITETREKLRTYSGKYSASKLVVEELPTFRVKKVSFNRI
jgi:hypothetical protein